MNNDLVRNLALRAMVGVMLVLSTAIAVAQEEGENGKMNGGGKEEEDGWKYKATVNRAFVFSNDGKRRSRFVDNDQDNSALALEWEQSLGRGWKLGFQSSFDFKYPGSDAVSQIDPHGRLVTEVGDLFFELGHESVGKIILGHSDSASDGTADVNLASTVLANAEVENWNSSYFLRVPGIGLTSLKWGDYFAGPEVGGSGRFLTYVTPKMMGFEAKVSVGQPQDIFLSGEHPWFQEKTGGVLADIGLFYSGVWDKKLRVKAALGVFKDTTEDKNATERTEDFGVGGGFAAMHLPTGLNMAFGTGVVKHTDRCAEAGVVSGKCRGDDTFVYVKGGVVRKIFSSGPTDLYGEFYRGRRSLNESDDATLPALEFNIGEAEELRGTEMTVWGLGVVQTIDASRSRPFVTDLYVGYRNYSLDTSLISAEAAVASKDVENFHAVMAGLRFRWGKIDKEDE